MAQKIATEKTRARRKIDQSPCWDYNFDGRYRSDECLPLRYSKTLLFLI
jgi:hypothetical protein